MLVSALSFLHMKVKHVNGCLVRIVKKPKIALMDELSSLLTREISDEYLNVKALYGKLSKFVHASIRAIGPLFLTPKKLGDELKVDVEFPPVLQKGADSVCFSIPAIVVVGVDNCVR